MNKTLLNVILLCFIGCLIGLLMLAQPIQAQNSEGQAYIIQLNDTLWKLAEKYLESGHHYPAIVEATANKAATDSSFSPITDPDLLRPGQKIWIPTSTEIVTAPPETELSSPISTTEVVAISNSDEPTGHIAFSFWNNSPSRCTYEINIINISDCLQDAAQCQTSRRIIPLNSISEPALSPNGQQLAFRSWGAPNPNGPYANCASAHPFRQLGRSTLNGTEYVSLTNFWEDAHPDWSPDGNRIIFDSARTGDGVTRIFATSPDGKREEDFRIIGQQPAWAADNQHFVYRGCDVGGNRCGIWQANAIPVAAWDTAKNIIGPIIEDGEAAHPDWSPVANEIVYQSPMGGDWGLHIINTDGTDPRALTTQPGIEGLPVWSPDGQWIAYVAHDGQQWNLRLINRAGTDDRLLFTFDGGAYDLPVASDPYGARSWLDEQISWSP